MKAKKKRKKKQMFSYVGTILWIEPVLKTEDKVFCTRPQHHATCENLNPRPLSHHQFCHGTDKMECLWVGGKERCPLML